MPYETIENFSDHGVAKVTIEDDLQGARDIFTALEGVGIHYDVVTQQLLDEGVKKFADSFHQLFNDIKSKQQGIKQGQTA